MTNEQMICMVLKNGLLLLFLWFAITYLYKEHIVDCLRQHLFTLRDRLFLIAAQDKALFKNEAYKMLREQINSHLRYAHKLEFVKILAMFFLGSKNISHQAELNDKRWKCGYSKLSPEVQAQFVEIKSKISDNILGFTVQNSFLLMFLLFVIFTVLLPTVLLIKFISRNLSLYNQWRRMKHASGSKLAAAVLGLSEIEDNFSRV